MLRINAFDHVENGTFTLTFGFVEIHNNNNEKARKVLNSIAIQFKWKYPTATKWKKKKGKFAK